MTDDLRNALHASFFECLPKIDARLAEIAAKCEPLRAIAERCEPLAQLLARCEPILSRPRPARRADF